MTWEFRVLWKSIWRKRERRKKEKGKYAIKIKSTVNFHLFFWFCLCCSLSLSFVSPALLDRHDWAKAATRVVSLGRCPPGDGSQKIKLKEIGDKQEIPYYDFLIYTFFLSRAFYKEKGFRNKSNAFAQVTKIKKFFFIRLGRKKENFPSPYRCGNRHTPIIVWRP